MASFLHCELTVLGAAAAKNERLISDRSSVTMEMSGTARKTHGHDVGPCMIDSKFSSFKGHGIEIFSMSLANPAAHCYGKCSLYWLKYMQV